MTTAINDEPDHLNHLRIADVTAALGVHPEASGPLGRPELCMNVSSVPVKAQFAGPD